MLCSCNKSIRSVFSRFNAASVARVIASGEKSCGISRCPRPGLAVRNKVVADLGCDNDFVALLWKCFRDQFFAQAISIDVRGIEQRHAEIERLVHERDRFAFGEISPPTSRDRPKSETDFTHFQVGVFVNAKAHGET